MQRRTSALLVPVDLQPAQQIGPGVVPLRGPAGVGFLGDRHQAHEAQQSPDAFLVRGMALALQVPGYLLNALDRGFQELLVNQQREVEVYRRLALRRVVAR